jgi:glycosyltransferase involved in cell wall biosynthesis
MKISYYAPEFNLRTTVGYGQAGFNIVRSLQKLGHEVPFDDATAPVQISFCSPTAAKFHEDQYKIIYTPWESTELPDGWLEAFNAADEVWATSEWVSRVYRDAGVTRPIYVYHHGVADIWKKPQRRGVDGTFRFLHIGEAAPRKGGQLALDAFLQEFKDDEDVEITFKCHFANYLRMWKAGQFSEVDHPKVNIINDEYYESEMLKLFHDHDTLVYASYGEGFGLIPLQALATGMPVISTYDWAPYADYINLRIPAVQERSVWPYHPGDVYYPDFAGLRRAMRSAYEAREYYAERAFNSTEHLYEEYDWVKLTERAFAHIVDKFA